jgi:hypothetical protein
VGNSRGRRLHEMVTQVGQVAGRSGGAANQDGGRVGGWRWPRPWRRHRPVLAA